MDAVAQIEKFKDFFEKNYKVNILEAIRKGENYLYVDFMKLLDLDPNISTLLLDYPEEIIKAAEIAIEHFDIPETVKGFRIRFINLPQSQERKIREIRSRHLEKFWRISCIVGTRTNVIPHLSSARYECPSCGHVLTIIQVDEIKRVPNRCSCGRKGKFKEISNELIDAQSLVLQENPEELSGDQQPQQIKAILKEDLVSVKNTELTKPGKRLIMNGILKGIPIWKGKMQSIKMEFLFEINSFEAVDEDSIKIQITKEDEKEIKQFAKQEGCIQKIVKMMAPAIYGNEEIKEGLLYGLVGGNQIIDSDGHKERGDIHVLQVGDPGLAKTQLLRRVFQISPKAVYASGKGVSGPGITASVIKDELTGGWTLAPGPLVIAHKGVLCLDEIDKMRPDDRSHMHDGMESQKIHINKAGINQTLNTETTVIAAGNPKNGKFDTYGNFVKQIDLETPLINRFDLIFAITDEDDEEKDKNLAKHKSIRIKEAQQQKKQKKESGSQDIFLRKYLTYARDMKPIWNDNALDHKDDWYVKIRKKRAPGSIPLNPRQLETIKRLAEANAKLQISDKVTIDNVNQAIDIMEFMLNQMGCISEDGAVSTDNLVGADYELRIVKRAIHEVDIPLKPIDLIIEKASELDKGITKSIVYEKMKSLKISGDIFEPKTGFIQKL